MVRGRGTAGRVAHGWASAAPPYRSPAIVNDDARRVLTFKRTGVLAVLIAAATLPLSGPVHAGTEMIAVAAVQPAGTEAISAQPIPGPNAATALPVPTPVEALYEPPVYQPIGSGMASYYGPELAGARTASGARFDPAALTAAHRTLPFGTRVQVTNAATGDSVIVTINDRGPFHGNRVIDLSQAAAQEIGIARMGSGLVQLAVPASAY